MAPGQVKGTTYLSTLQFIDQKFGGDARARVLARLSDEDRAFLGGLLLPIGWYPTGPLPRLLHALDEELGRGDLALVEQRGAWVADRDLKTTHRLLLKVVTPSWVIEKATSLWKNFHDTGRWESMREGKSAAVARLYDHVIVDAAMCATLSGWMRGLLTVAGCRSIEMQHPICRTRGGAHCEWRVAWT
jgi:hypothetical protein